MMTLASSSSPSAAISSSPTHHSPTHDTAGNEDKRVPINCCLFNILPLNENEQAKRVLCASQPALFHQHHCVFLTLAGEPHLSSALLFQSAVSLCTEARHVVYLRRSAIQQLPPAVALMPTPEPMSMDLVQFVYLSTLDDVISYLSAAHKWKHGPVSALMIDLSSYCDTTSSVSAIRLWRLEAAVREAALHLASLQHVSSVVTIMADSSSSRRRLDRWPVTVTITAQSSDSRHQHATLVCTNADTPAVLLHLDIDEHFITLVDIEQSSPNTLR